MDSRTRTIASSNETQTSNFSCGIAGSSSYITPTINAGNAQTINNQDEKGMESGRL